MMDDKEINVWRRIYQILIEKFEILFKLVSHPCTSVPGLQKFGKLLESTKNQSVLSESSIVLGSPVVFSHISKLG